MHCGKLILLTMLSASCLAAGPQKPDIELVGKGSLPPTLTDKSGLTDILSDGTPHNSMGSCGSAIAYTGIGNRYLMLADRGPADGATPFQCRFHVVDIALQQPGAISLTLQDTKILKDKTGCAFVGLSSAIGNDALRLDPEGVRVGAAGKLYLSDEYGPGIYEFNLEGRFVRALPVPPRFQINHKDGSSAIELERNSTGRVPNRGLEGLAISPDGRTLTACMQGPLIQDGGKAGTEVRILEVDLKTQRTREFIYPLENSKCGVSEILAINEREFLVIERTGSSDPAVPQFAQVFRIDISKATDVGRLDRLPNPLTNELATVRKVLMFDLLDPQFGLAGPQFPTKIEGLAFGPDLPDGRHLLLVTSDNDCGTSPTQIFAFAIEPSAMPNFQPQVFDRAK